MDTLLTMSKKELTRLEVIQRLQEKRLRQHQPDLLLFSEFDTKDSSAKMSPYGQTSDKKHEGNKETKCGYGCGWQESAF